MAPPDVLMFHIGTNNWQRQGEFAPGSGILHASFHQTFNSMKGVRCYSMFPSKKQEDPVPEPDYEPTFRVFKLTHDIPICESHSPNSSYRWHQFSEAEYQAYLTRLENEVCTFMDEIEEREGKPFDYLVSHHAFTNAMTGAQILKRRQDAGNKGLRHYNFVHGTALKMYIKEKDKDPEYPERFLPLVLKHNVFQGNSATAGVWVNSQDFVKKFQDIFTQYPAQKVIYSQIGVNQKIFRATGSKVADDLAKYIKAEDKARFDGAGVKRIITFVGKFADWKRLDGVLHAAKVYEDQFPDLATIIVGTGPQESIDLYTGVASKLALKRVFFIGPQGQPDLAQLFSMSEAGIFPSYCEPFGMVFIECAACGCPMIGAKSGGPVEFVTDKQGVLVPEEPEWQTEAGIAKLGASLADSVKTAIGENWKQTKGPGCVQWVADNFSTFAQCDKMLQDMKSWA